MSQGEVLLSMQEERMSHSSRIESTENYYEILGVEKSVTSDQLRVQYRRLCLLFHPDKCSEGTLQNIFQKISLAYKVLSEPVERKKYDHQLQTAANRLIYANSGVTGGAAGEYGECASCGAGIFLFTVPFPFFCQYCKGITHLFPPPNYHAVVGNADDILPQGAVGSPKTPVTLSRTKPSVVIPSYDEEEASWKKEKEKKKEKAPEIKVSLADFADDLRDFVQCKGFPSDPNIFQRISSLSTEPREKHVDNEKRLETSADIRSLMATLRFKKKRGRKPKATASEVTEGVNGNGEEPTKKKKRKAKQATCSTDKPGDKKKRKTKGKKAETQQAATPAATVSVSECGVKQASESPRLKRHREEFSLEALASLASGLPAVASFILGESAQTVKKEEREEERDPVSSAMSRVVMAGEEVAQQGKGRKRRQSVDASEPSQRPSGKKVAKRLAAKRKEVSEGKGRAKKKQKAANEKRHVDEEESEGLASSEASPSLSSTSSVSSTPSASPRPVVVGRRSLRARKTPIRLLESYSRIYGSAPAKRVSVSEIPVELCVAAEETSTETLPAVTAVKETSFFLERHGSESEVYLADDEAESDRRKKQEAVQQVHTQASAQEASAPCSPADSRSTASTSSPPRSDNGVNTASVSPSSSSSFSSSYSVESPVSSVNSPLAPAIETPLT